MNRVGRWLINDANRTARVDKMPQFGPVNRSVAHAVLWPDALAHATFKYNGAGREWDSIILEDIDGNSVKLTRSILKEALELMEAFQPGEEVEPTDHRAAAVSTAARILQEGIDRAVQAFQTVVTEADDSRALRIEIERLANERYDIRTAYESLRRGLMAELDATTDGVSDAEIIEQVKELVAESSSFVNLRNTIQSLLGDVAGTPVNDEVELERRLRQALRSSEPDSSDDSQSVALLSVTVLALLRATTVNWKEGDSRQFHLPNYFPSLGGALRNLPGMFGYDAGPFRVEKKGNALTITYRSGQ